MGPGRTVFIKGEVNKTAKGSVPLLSGLARILATCISSCLILSPDSLARWEQDEGPGPHRTCETGEQGESGCQPDC